MNEKDIRSYLATHPLFEKLKSEYLSILQKGTSNIQFEPDEIIFRENEPADKLYLIRYGRVAIEAQSISKKPKLTLQIIDAGEVLGWSWLVSPYKWHFDARALWQTRAIMLDGKFIREQCEKRHDLGYELYRRFAPIITQRLQVTRAQLVDIYN